MTDPYLPPQAPLADAEASRPGRTRVWVSGVLAIGAGTVAAWFTNTLFDRMVPVLESVGADLPALTLAFAKLSVLYWLLPAIAIALLLHALRRPFSPERGRRSITWFGIVILLSIVLSVLATYAAYEPIRALGRVV